MATTCKDKIIRIIDPRYVFNLVVNCLKDLKRIERRSITDRMKLLKELIISTISLRLQYLDQYPDPSTED